MTSIKKYPIPTSEQENIEEALGSLWQNNAQGSYVKSDVLPKIEESVNKEIYPKLVSLKFIQEEGASFKLTDRGMKLAKDVTRRHRLAERLLSDVLALSSQAVDPNACMLEHIISPEVAESICTLLGHPKQCPHGHPIPAGSCCKGSSETIEPIILSLDKFESGNRGKIAYILLQNHPDLHKLLALGIVPGTHFSLHQTYPTYVLEVGETTLALEKDIAEKIFVRRAD